MFDASYQSKAEEKLRNRYYAELGLLPHLKRRQIVKLGELPLHCELYFHSKDAPTLIFIPGIGTYSELYCELLARLCDEGFNLIAVDLRGHGYSGGERGAYTVDEVIGDIQQVIDYLQQQFSGPIGVFGCSIGARLGLAVAEQDSRISALLCHTLFLAEIPPDIWHSIGWNSLYFSNLFTPSMKVSFRTFIDVDNLLKYNPLGQLADKDPLLVWDYPVSTLYSLYSRQSRILKQSLGMPAAIIIGTEDDVIRPEYVRQLVSRSSHPFELIEISGGSHMLPFDHIDDTLRACSEWFNNVFSAE